MTYFGYPLQIDSRGRTAEASYDEHIRQMIEQILFTTPGERVNRPDFGSDIRQFVFAPSTSEQAPAIQFLIQGALHQWLGELILVEGVEIEQAENLLLVTIQYVVRQTQNRHVAQFEELSLL